MSSADLQTHSVDIAFDTIVECRRHREGRGLLLCPTCHAATHRLMVEQRSTFSRPALDAPVALVDRMIKALELWENDDD